MSKNHRLVLRIENPIRNTTVMSFEQGSYSVSGQGIGLSAIDNADNQTGDEAFMQSLYDASNGGSWTDNTGWNDGNMSLSDSPYGITTDTIGGELRITKVDLRNNNLTGNINFTEWENLKENTYVNVTFNSLNSQIPQELMDLPKCEYYYFSRSDTGLEIGTDPHEEAATGSGDVGLGKGKGSENNVFTGALPAPSNPSAMSLKWFVLSFTDSDRDNPDGISSIPSEIFDIPTMEGVQFMTNENVANMPFPDGIKNMTNATILAVKQSKDGGFFTGSIPAGTFDNLSNMKFLDIAGHPNLTIDTDVVDFSGMTSLRSIDIGSNDFTGSRIPAEFFDGTMPDFYEFRAAFTTDDIGVGPVAHSAIDPNLNGGIGLKVVQWREHSLTSIHPSMWDNGAIIQLDLTKNLLTTLGTKDLTNMTALRYLRLSQNELFENAPYLPWDREIPGGIQIQDNKYVFKHLLYVPPNAPAGETLLELYYSITQEGEFEYSPQKNFGTSRSYDTVDGNGDIVIDDFDAILEHEDNEYQWQKDENDISDGAEYSNTNTKVLTIIDADEDDDGTYTLDVTNTTESSIGVGMTITSQSITVNLTQ